MADSMMGEASVTTRAVRRAVVAGLAGAAILAACADDVGAKRAAENLGLTNVETHGYAFLGCDEKDTFHTRFTAKNAQGKDVSGVVCGGWLKKATVRFD